MTTKQEKDQIDRAKKTLETVRKLVEGAVYKAPEIVPEELWSLFMVLSEHFAESHARADIAHAASIWRHLAHRRETEPGFAAAIDDFITSRGDAPPCDAD